MYDIHSRHQYFCAITILDYAPGIHKSLELLPGELRRVMYHQLLLRRRSRSQRHIFRPQFGRRRGHSRRCHISFNSHLVSKTVGVGSSNEGRRRGESKRKGKTDFSFDSMVVSKERPTLILGGPPSPVPLRHPVARLRNPRAGCLQPSTISVVSP